MTRAMTRECESTITTPKTELLICELDVCSVWVSQRAPLLIWANVERARKLPLVLFTTQDAATRSVRMPIPYRVLVVHSTA